MPASSVIPWPPREIEELRRKLDELSELVRKPYVDEPQDVRDWLARILVVRSCGYLEQTVLEASRGYVQARSGGPTRAFARSWLGRGKNPTPETLIAHVGRFDANWAENLREFLEADDEGLHREISFLVDRRNKISHGLNEGIGTVKALRLSEVACEVSDWFIARFNPER